MPICGNYNIWCSFSVDQNTNRSGINDRQLSAIREVGFVWTVTRQEEGRVGCSLVLGLSETVTESEFVKDLETGEEK